MTLYRTREVDGSDPEIASDLRDLQETCFGDSAPVVSTSEGYWWITYHGDEPAAFAGMVPSQQMDNTGYLIRSGVLPSHRGQGLQVRLLRVREAKARKLGWSRLNTDTTDNPASANSLIKAGYRLFEPKHPWGLHRAIYWKKEITPSERRVLPH